MYSTDDATAVPELASSFDLFLYFFANMAPVARRRQCRKIANVAADSYDVAVLKLSRSVGFRDNILPICLPPQGKDYEGALGVVAGWGKTDTSFGEPTTRPLPYTPLPGLAPTNNLNKKKGTCCSRDTGSTLFSHDHFITTNDFFLIVRSTECPP